MEGRLIYLGFGLAIEPDAVFRLRSHYLPLGKIGGKPAWLNPVYLPPNNDLCCKVCMKPMAFLLQIYATNSNDEDYCFHRTLFIFICRSGKCSQVNNSSNIRAFRCQLPRVNAFYSAERPLDPDIDGSVPDPLANSSYPHLCTICGCFATKRCARCEDIWYCSRDHQILDWTSGHKTTCGSRNSEESSKEIGENLEKVLQNSSVNRFLFPEYTVDMGTEWSLSTNSESSDDESEDEVTEALERRMKDYRNYVKAHQNDLSTVEFEECEDSIVKDTSYERFNKILALNPEQILRYDRGGKALLATDQVPFPSSIPCCPLCGAARQYEMQLMPHLLTLLKVDSLGESIDWATVMLYTCSDNCHIKNDAYAEEFVFKQDFQ